MPAPLSVADVLFGKTRRGVLALLFGNPGRSYHLREIVRNAGSGVSQVQVELDRLTRAGLLIREPRAHQVWFQANAASAIFHELVVLVAKTFGIGDVVRGALAGLGERIDVAFIYGQVARGEHRETSDIDLLVVGDALLSDLDPALRSIETKLARTVSPTLLDAKTYRKRRAEGDPFLRSVLAGPRIFVAGDASALKALDRPAVERAALAPITAAPGPGGARAKPGAAGARSRRTTPSRGRRVASKR